MFQWKQYELGVCYYPEQWDESLWCEDLRRMKEAGIGTVRVAEFCWVIFEPAEGEFHFGRHRHGTRGGILLGNL